LAWRSATGWASPAQGLDTLQRKNNESDLMAIAAVCEQNEVERLVVGLPLNMDGSEGPRAEVSRRFGDKLALKTGLPSSTGTSGSPPPRPSAS